MKKKVGIYLNKAKLVEAFYTLEQNGQLINSRISESEEDEPRPGI